MVTDKQVHKTWDYGREKLEEALEAVESQGADLEVLAPLQLALMAFTLCYGDMGPITLNAADVLEYINDPGPVCICPPGLVERGGFRGGCPVHG